METDDIHSTPDLTTDPLDAYQRMASTFERIPKSALLPVNLNIPEVVQTVISTIPDILQLRQQLRTIGCLDMSMVDTLRDTALALVAAHVKVRTCGGGVDLAPLAREQRLARHQLKAAAAPFVALGLIDGNRIKRLNGASYQRVAFDVIALVDLFLSSWDAFADKTPYSRDELLALRASAERFLSVQGDRQTSGSTAAAAALAQRQVFTLLVRNYAEIRVVLQFIRRAEGDADKIAPSLFRGRGKRPSRSAAKPAEPKEGTCSSAPDSKTT